ncbi:MAG: hypothetical protein OXI24_12180 [Candidatus Poribacteria bacterium]|nr:hypothetical protein [Candidatus Poribacteria bacterium]
MTHEIGDRVKLHRNDNDAVVIDVEGELCTVYNRTQKEIQVISFNNLYDPVDSAYIVRQHADTWASLRMGKYMFLCCIGAASVNDDNASVLIMDMKSGKIAHKSDNEIIQMIRENDDSDSPDDYTDDEMMFDYTRNEYI